MKTGPSHSGPGILRTPSGIAPCREACPAGVDVPRYVRLIAGRKFPEALAVVRERIPFPSVCGWVCFRPCEARCRGNGLNGPVAIRALKRFVAERPHGVYAEKPNVTRTGKSIAVVGSGPAGLTAAYYLAKLGGHSVTVFEALAEAGGTMRAGIPRYRLPAAVLDAEIDEIRRVGVEIKTSARVESVDNLLNQGCDAVFLAIGARLGLRLGIQGEQTAGVLDAVSFLQAVNAGQTPNLGNRVVIIGGGNAAIDAARTALRLGANKVTILYRRSRAEMPADGEETEEALREGVEIRYLVAPAAVSGTASAMTLSCIRTELGEAGPDGRRSVRPVSGSGFNVEADSVIAAIGQAPGIGPLMGLGASQAGLLAANPETLATGRTGVFAGGDAVTGPASVIEAIAAGRKAAAAIDRYLGGKGILDEALAPVDGAVAPLKPSLPVGERAAIPSLPLEQRLKGFQPVELPMTEDAAIAQAMRCLRCDLPIEIDSSKCTGCRICELRCSLRVEQQFNPGHARIRIKRLIKQPNEFQASFTDECDACGVCARYCPYGCIIRRRTEEVAR